MKKHIPNLFTFLNMASGLVALTLVFDNQLVWAATFVFLGIFFDFFDGFFARLLNVQSELGVQLDSLADLITSGVVPGAVVYQILLLHPENGEIFPYTGFILTLAAGYRLAKFNIDTRQSEQFIGLPTPAMSIFVVSIPVVIAYQSHAQWNSFLVSNVFLGSVIILFSYLMNSELRLFALKFKHFSWKENEVKYLFLTVSVFLLLLLKGLAVPLLILLYIFLSIGIEVYHYIVKK